MSRIIVKNLPKGMKEERLTKLFSQQGHITDCSMKYTKDGVFRKFAFIGYQAEEEALRAVKHFNKSFIDTSKIQVEIAKGFGDKDKPRAWSKYSSESSAYQKKLIKTKESADKESKDAPKDKKSEKVQDREKKVDELLLGELKDDPEFQEFLEAHKNRSTKATWSNDATASSQSNVVLGKGKMVKQDVEFDDEDDDDSDSGMEEVALESDKEEDTELVSSKTAAKKDLSDLEYLKTKVTKASHLSDSSDAEESSSDEDSKDEDGSNEEEEEGEKVEEETLARKKTDQKPGDSEPPQVGPSAAQHVIKMKGLPTNVKEKQIREFFHPVMVKSVKIPRNAKGSQAFRVATVEFATDKDVESAVRRNRNFIGSKKIHLYKVKAQVMELRPSKPRPWEVKLQRESGQDEEEETIAESGRLYVRNLAYVCTEENLEELFGKFGPISEVHVPVDSLTKKVKGFAFVSFMMPEHAVRAFTELDGTPFQGRMLHILPAKARKEDNMDTSDETSFKKKREAKQKSLAGSSHNWNTLFLGANAVADVMADKYKTSKSDILDPESKQSLGVRMALGETQVVAETREFLVENGVALDAFSQAAAQRSKTVILVKNLPAGTKDAELREVFGKFGSIGRLVLPPSGITAIVEYMVPAEARSGFKHLAYTKFKHMPLYLEWAPMGVFTSAAGDAKQETAAAEDKPDKPEPESSSESEDEEETTGCSVFVKNLNFDTTEEAVKEKFSKCGTIRSVVIAKKKDMKNPGKFLSMGYGFVEFKKRESAQKAIKQLQHTELDDHALELKISNRATAQKPVGKKKQDTKKKQKSSKILVRNIPFEAKVHELKELFCVFGEVKTVRLPKKLSGTGSHRGFGFVDFLSKQDAKRAFNALCHSTHLYGRRLVLEWADTEETVDQLRKKTADHFHEGGPSKRFKKSSLMEELKATSSLE